jgi:hypothetical protein
MVVQSMEEMEQIDTGSGNFTPEQPSLVVLFPGE